MEKEEFAKRYTFTKNGKYINEYGCMGHKFDLVRDLPKGFKLVTIKCWDDGWGVVTR